MVGLLTVTETQRTGLVALLAATLWETGNALHNATSAGRVETLAANVIAQVTVGALVIVVVSAIEAIVAALATEVASVIVVASVIAVVLVIEAVPAIEVIAATAATEFRIAAARV